MVCETILETLGASLDAALLLDSNGQILYKNSVAKKLYAFDGESDTRREASSLFFLEDTETEGKKTLDSFLFQMKGTNSMKFEGAFAIAKDGTTFSATISLSKLAQCKCCNTQGTSESVAHVYCVYIKQNGAQTFLLRSFEKEIKCLQMSANAIEASFDAFFSISPSGTILMVNQAATDLFGWTRDELINQNISIICGADHASKHNRYLTQYLSSGESRLMGTKRRLPAKKKDGTEFAIELGLRELRSTCGRAFCAFVKDVSGGVVHQQEMRSKDEQLSGMINASFDAMFQIDETGLIQMANDAVSKQFGYSHKELIGSNISLICGDEHSKHHDTYMKRYLEIGDKRVIGKRREEFARRKDGSQFPIELSVTEVSLSDGKRMFCGFARDLSKQKLAEEKVKVMIDSAFDPMFEINSKGIIQLVNNAASNVFGWTQEEFLGENISIICGREHAKNHDGYMARYLQTGEKRVMGKKRELKAVNKNGEEFPIELGLTEMVLDGGSRVFCGFVRDLTQQKLDLKRIQRKQELTVGMINAAFDPMFQTDARGSIQLVNQAACDHFGWTREEFIGSNISMIAGGRDGKNHDKYMKHYLATGEKRVMGRKRHLTAMKKDGTTFPIELGLTEVNTIWGEKIFCGFVRDLRREKFDEQEIVEKEKLTRGIVEASADALLVVDENGTIQQVNDAATFDFGWAKSEFVGRNLKMVMSSDYIHKNVLDVKKFILSARGRQKEIEARSQNNSSFKMYFHLTEIEGPFPILLGLTHSASPGTPSGSRMFAIFLSEKERNRRNVMDSLMESKRQLFGSLAESKRSLMETLEKESAHSRQ